MAAAQQLARAGHDVTLFEKNDRIGGLLRYGIPDFKMEKAHIDRRVEQMKAEGVTFRTGVMVGKLPEGSKVTNWAKETVTPEELQKQFDAVLLTAAPSSRATCRYRAATWTASTSPWSSCRSKTRSTRATRSRARSAPTASTSS
jgi:phytoene dehydrogenase-like protein